MESIQAQGMPADIFKLDIRKKGALSGKVISFFELAVERLLALDRFNFKYAQVSTPGDERPFTERALEVLNITYSVTDRDRAAIPATGPVVVVANHPFGMVEGIILAELLRSVRSDVQFLGNSILSRIPEIRDWVIPADPFGTKDSTRFNFRAMKQSLQWLKNDGMLAVFPAGEVSHLNLKERCITDPAWNDNVARIIRTTGADVLPVFFNGSNDALFHLMGLIHPRLRTIMLPSQLLNKGHQNIELRIGNLIPNRRLAEIATDKTMTDFLRMRTYILANRGRGNPAPTRSAPGRRGISLFPVFRKNSAEPVVPEIGGEVLATEISQLPQAPLLKSGEYDVFCIKSSEAPNVIREIGRLREITFREAGEGTGMAIDLDRFDKNYRHLFVWHREKREVVGAYRLGLTDEILTKQGKQGLYTSTLFSYQTRLLRQIDPALELGRSFVRREYQKEYAPLLLLWKGIGQFVVRNPRYRYLFGPVSIANSYSHSSRSLMVKFLEMNNYAHDLGKQVKARNPFKHKQVQGWDAGAASRVVSDIEDVSRLVDDIETSPKGVPVLLRQYLRLGGKLLGFNVDPDFGDVVDGLILVDILEADRKMFERYMGKEGLELFLAYHRTSRKICDDKAGLKIQRLFPHMSNVGRLSGNVVARFIGQYT